MVFLVPFAVVAFLLTTRFWRWYDAILHYFSSFIRIVDLFTWGLLLWWIVIQYQKAAELFTQMLFWRIIYYLLIWVGITVIGCMIIGFLRLFIKREFFN